jgi:SsrA-binding protein
MMKITTGQKILSKNQRAFFDYFLSDFLEVGLMLTGTEIKSVREGGAVLSDSYVIIKNHELWILNMHIAPYKRGNIFNHEPLRTRKLLLHKAEIARFAKSTREKGLTIMPTKLYLAKGVAKLEIALAKGKKNYDKREAIKKRELSRKLDKAIKGDLRD